MKNFIKTAMEMATAEDAREPDTSPEAWSVRAFSVISTLGEYETVDETVGTLLAKLLALAPTEVVMQSTLQLMDAHERVAQILNPPEFPEN